MRRFLLDRMEDASGVSGCGIIAEGVQFSNGRCAMSWKTQHTSTAIYDSIIQLEEIHGHNGATVVRWIDEAFLKS